MTDRPPRWLGEVGAVKAAFTMHIGGVLGFGDKWTFCTSVHLHPGTDHVEDDLCVSGGRGHRRVSGHGGNTKHIGVSRRNNEGNGVVVPRIAIDDHREGCRHAKRLVVVCQSGEMAFDVVVVGSANLDLVAQLDRLPQPGETLRATSYAEYAGGKGLNQAVACARMGAHTAFVGCVGGDDAGAFLRTVLEIEGIDITHVRTVDAPTGRALINVDAHGENAIVVISGANAMVGDEGSSFEIPTGKVVLAQLEVPQTIIVTAFTHARRQGSQTVLNPAPAAALSAELLRATDLIVPNETEALALGGSEALLSAGVTTVVMTQGEHGADIITTSGTQHIDAFSVTPIDTVGAGDAFIGAMCAELARGSSLHDACRLAAVAGALATTVRGAVPSLPTRAAVLAAQDQRR